MKSALALLVVLIAAPLAAEGNEPFGRDPRDHETVVQAITRGVGMNDQCAGLLLEDSASGFMRAMETLSVEKTVTSGFSVELYTPVSWISEQARRAAARGDAFTSEHVTEEMRRPVLRIVANPDMPTKSGSFRGASSVASVSVRATDFEVCGTFESETAYYSLPDVAETQGLTPEELKARMEAGTMALEPRTKRGRAFVEIRCRPHVEPSALEKGFAVGETGGNSVSFLRKVIAEFDLAGVREVAKANKKGEFIVAVLGATGEEKEFKVKTKHFARLP